MKIFPLQFARAIQQAVAYRSDGMSQVEAATQACRTVGIADDWAMIIHLTMNEGSSLAEDWCERVIKDALDRAYSYEGEFR